MSSSNSRPKPKRRRKLEKLTPFLWRRREWGGAGAWYLHWCQGCKHAHVFPVGHVDLHNWTFNGDLKQPSFSPSMLIYSGGWQRPDGREVPRRVHCHYFLTNGALLFQSDSPHEFSGQAAPLEPIPHDYAF